MQYVLEKPTPSEGAQFSVGVTIRMFSVFNVTVFAKEDPVIAKKIVDGWLSRRDKDRIAKVLSRIRRRSYALTAQSRFRHYDEQLYSTASEVIDQFYYGISFPIEIGEATFNFLALPKCAAEKGDLTLWSLPDEEQDRLRKAIKLFKRTPVRQ